MPLDFVYENIDENGYEFDFIKKMQKYLLNYLHTVYLSDDAHYKELVDSVINKEQQKRSEPFDHDIMLKELCDDKFPVECFYHNYRQLFDYFDDWIVIDSDMKIKCRKNEDNHIETIEW